MVTNMILYAGSRAKSSSPHFKASDISSFWFNSWYNRTINKIYENAFPISKRGKSISSITRG
jgi:hypothetical protein